MKSISPPFTFQRLHKGHFSIGSSFDSAVSTSLSHDADRMSMDDELKHYDALWGVSQSTINQSPATVNQSSQVSQSQISQSVTGRLNWAPPNLLIPTTQLSNNNNNNNTKNTNSQSASRARTIGPISIKNSHAEPKAESTTTEDSPVPVSNAPAITSAAARLATKLGLISW